MDGPIPTSPRTLKAFFRERAFLPRKSRGQSFLVRDSVAERLVASLALSPADSVLEIGGGLGALSRLLAGQAAKVAVFEPDPILFAFLKETFRESAVTVLQDDFRKADISALAPAGKRVKVIGNLPYALTSDMLLYLFKNRHRIETAVVTIQREVAERCLARPGGKSYSPLSCVMQYAAELTPLFQIPPEAFYPKPAITSQALRIAFLPTPKVAVSDEDFFFRVIRTAFGKRRKQLVNSLTGSLFSKEQVTGALKEAKVTPSRRAEELSLQDFARLCEALRRD